MALWHKTVAPFSEHKGGVGPFLKIPRSNSEKIFKDFYHIWARWPYWSCDLDGLIICLFLPTKKATNEIWFQMAQGLLRCLKLLHYGESWVKSQTMTLTSSTHKSSCSHEDNSIYHFLGQNLQKFP